MPLCIHLICGSPETCGVRPSWLWFSLICSFSLIAVIDPLCIHFLCYTETGAKGREMQEHWVSCQEPNSLFCFFYNIDDSIEDSPNHDLVFSFQVASPKILFGIFFFQILQKCKHYQPNLETSI